jgi:AraC-like DNA-binding protein
MKHLSSDTGRLPCSRFDTDWLPPDDRFDLWRDSMALIFAPQRARSADESFSARIHIYHLDQLLFSEATSTGQRFRRGRAWIPDGVDHFLVQLHRGGGYGGNNGQREMSVRPGDVSVLDLGRDVDLESAAFNNLTLIVPRDLLLSRLAKGTDPHGRVFARESATGQILGNHLSSVWRALPHANLSDIPAINGALLGGIAGCIGGGIDLGADSREETSRALEQSLLETICDHIEAHLHEPALNAALLQRSFHLSRATLYRLFRNNGGVTAYIRQRRLLRCYRHLAAGTTERIIDTALQWGFSSHSHFTRAFREEFGINPSDVQSEHLNRKLAAVAGHDQSMFAWRDWIRTL